MCLEWGQELNTHFFPLGPNRLLLAKLNKTVATWSLWEHKVPELTQVKTSGGPTQGLSHRCHHHGWKGASSFYSFTGLYVVTSPESKLTGSKAIAGPHRDTGTPGTQLAEISYQATCYTATPQGR